MVKGRPLKTRQDQHISKSQTPTATAYLARRNAAIATTGQGFSERMLRYQERPPPSSFPFSRSEITAFESEPAAPDLAPEFEEVFEPLQPELDVFQEPEDPLVSKLQSTDYQIERLLHEARWDSQYGPMLDAFLSLRNATHDWSSPFTWNQDFSEECVCPSSQRRVRQVDLVDIICESLVIQLLPQG